MLAKFILLFSSVIAAANGYAHENGAEMADQCPEITPDAGNECPGPMTCEFREASEVLRSIDPDDNSETLTTCIRRITALVGFCLSMLAQI